MRGLLPWLAVSLLVGCDSTSDPQLDRVRDELSSVAHAADPMGPERTQERAPDRGVPVAQRPETVLWVGGDVLLSGAIRRAVRQAGDPATGFAQVLEPVSRHWHADGEQAYVVVNMESPVAATRRNANDRYRHQKTGSVRVRTPLNAPAWVLSGLRRAGVDGITLANNHALDQEREGLAETLVAARAAGLRTTGAGLAPDLAAPLSIGPPEARTAVLALFEKDFPEPTLEPGMAGLSVLGPESGEVVRRLEASHDAVVVVVHVVAELHARDKPRWRRWATELAEAGADAIALHGSHVPGPVETLSVGGRDVPIAWSLGNLVSDMGAWTSPSRTVPPSPSKWDSPETREGLLMRVHVTRAGVQVRFLMTWMHSTRWLVNNRLSPAPPMFRLQPLVPCGAPTTLGPRWPPDQAAEMLAWIGGRRDHLLAVSKLVRPVCEERTADETLVLLSPPP